MKDTYNSTDDRRATDACPTESTTGSVAGGAFRADRDAGASGAAHRSEEGAAETSHRRRRARADRGAGRLVS